MRKRELEVTDPERILSILDGSKLLHLGLTDRNTPYVVPMNYGYTMDGGRLTLYLHCAHEGHKLDILRRNPTCSFAMECGVTPFGGKAPCQYGMSYDSIMGYGQVVPVENVEEKIRAMSLLMKTQTGRDFTFDARLVSIVTVLRIDVQAFSAKHRPLPERLQTTRE